MNNWSTEIPTTPGYYWTVRQVREYDRSPLGFTLKFGKPEIVEFDGSWLSVMGDEVGEPMPEAEDHVHWKGPIPTPELPPITIPEDNFAALVDATFAPGSTVLRSKG